MQGRQPVQQMLLFVALCVCICDGRTTARFVALSQSAFANKIQKKHHILLCDAPRNVMSALASRYEDRAAFHHLPYVGDEKVMDRLTKGDLDAFIVRSANTVTRSMVRNLPARVRAIGRAGVGCDNIDVIACEEAAIPVVTAAGANAVAVAEHTIALMLALARRIKPAAQSVANGRWEKAKLTGVGLRGKTVGVIGFGAIGTEVAKLCTGLGLQVLVAPPAEALSSSPDVVASRDERLRDCGAKGTVGINELLESSDFVTVHTPLTEKTRNSIGREQLEKMRPTSMLISTSRGGVIDETALLSSLEEKQIAGAALDVFESEGPNLGEDAVLMRLAALDSTVITPHVGGHTNESQNEVWFCVVDNILSTLRRQ